MMYLLHFIYGTIAAVGFSVLFHGPWRHMAYAGFAGGAGWLLYTVAQEYYDSVVIGGFLGAVAVSFLSDIFSRLCKETSTVFIIPGIIPIVPGAGMYYTTLYLITGQLELAADKGIQTLLVAGSISVGLLTVGSFFRMYTKFKSMQKNLHTKTLSKR